MGSSSGGGSRRAKRAFHCAVAQPAVIHGLAALRVGRAGLLAPVDFMARIAACASTFAFSAAAEWSTSAHGRIALRHGRPHTVTPHDANGPREPGWS